MNVSNYIESKITVPKVLQKVLSRRSVMEIIDSASLDEMICLVAPCGCGKTMAVISWLMKHNKETAWVNLDENEDSTVSFWGYLTAAILWFAGEKDRAKNIFTDTHFIKNARGFLRETLIRVSPAIKDKVLIIDNFRFIHNSELLREIRDIISNMLGCWRIIIIGRNELPPIFNDFMLRRRLRLITLNDLNFNLEEMNEYFLMNGLAVRREDLTQIRRDTDGWPAALNVILTVPHNGTIQYNDTAQMYVKGYFEMEIWEQLDETLKAFLMKTAILETLTPTICHYVAEIKETHHILRTLYANGIFVSKLEERESYRYHCLFQDFLLDKLHDSGMDINSLYVKAGWWLYERNESIAALRYFYKAKDMYGINMALKKIRPADIGMEKYLEATLFLTELNVMDLKDYPEVAARIALLHFITDNISEMQRIYAITLEWLEPGVLSIPLEEYVDFSWEIGWLRYVNPDENILFNKEFEYWANVSEYAPHLLESDRSRASVLRLPSVLRGVRDYTVNVNRTEEYYKLNIATQHGYIRDNAGLLIMDLIIAEIAYEREDFDNAEKIVKKILPEIENSKFTELYFSSTELLVKIARAIHSPKEIDALTSRLKKLIYNNGHFFLLPNFHAFELRNCLANGIKGVSEVFEKENEPYRDKAYYYLIYRQITYVRALLSEAKYTEAILMLGNLDWLCQQYKRNMDLIEVNILRSIAEYGLEHEEIACNHLEMALSAGRKCGFIRIFSDEAISIWPVLNLIRKNDIDDYIKKIIISCKKALARTGIVINTDKNGYEALTKKEIEILKLLQAGMSYEEIAFDNSIKVGTVKTHIHSIYRKLNVSNRTSALVLAQKNGIIKGEPFLVR